MRELSTDPFCVLFWSKEQQYYYSQIPNPCISVDATGGLISSSCLLSDIKSELNVDVRLSHIFLHLISVKNPDGNSVPVGQILSAQQDFIRISYFFKRWLMDFSMTTEIVMDDSAAYQKSSSESFTKCNDIKEYITKCSFGNTNIRIWCLLLSGNQPVFQETIQQNTNVECFNEEIF